MVLFQYASIFPIVPFFFSMHGTGRSFDVGVTFYALPHNGEIDGTGEKGLAGSRTDAKTWVCADGGWMDGGPGRSLRLVLVLVLVIDGLRLPGGQIVGRRAAGEIIISTRTRARNGVGMERNEYSRRRGFASCERSAEAWNANTASRGAAEEASLPYVLTEWMWV